MAEPSQAQALGERMVQAIKSYVARTLAPLARRQESADALLADLDKRIEALERKQ